MFNRITGWLVAAVVGALGFLGIMANERRKGRSQARAERNEDRLEAIKHKREDERDVSQMDDTSLADRISRGVRGDSDR